LYRHSGSVHSVQPVGGVEAKLYSFMTTAVEGGEGSLSRPGRSLPLGKTRYPLYKRLVGPRPGMDRCGKSRPHRDSIPGPSSPLPVAIPTELLGPQYVKAVFLEKCEVRCVLSLALTL